MEEALYNMKHINEHVDVCLTFKYLHFHTKFVHTAVWIVQVGEGANGYY